MMGLSVTTQQVFHGQTLNFAIKLQQKYAVSWKKGIYWNVFGFQMIYSVNILSAEGAEFI